MSEELNKSLDILELERIKEIPEFDSFDFKIFSRYYKIWFFLC